MDRFLNVRGESAELLLHGIVGKEINGTEIANKLKALKDLGVKHVKERQGWHPSSRCRSICFFQPF